MPPFRSLRLASLALHSRGKDGGAGESHARLHCWSMTMTPSGAAYLVEGVTLSSLLPSSSVSFLGENLDLMVRQWWRQWRHLLLGGFAVSVLPALEPWGAYPIHLVQASWRLPLSPDPLILSSLHLHHHFWLLRSLLSCGCFVTWLVGVRLGGCFATFTCWTDALPSRLLFDRALW